MFNFHDENLITWSILKTFIGIKWQKFFEFLKIDSSDECYTSEFRVCLYKFEVSLEVLVKMS